MSFRPLPLAFLLALGATAPSCDRTNTGQRPIDRSPPVLLKVLIQDEQVSGGRNVATDLLDRSPKIGCSERDPCPAGDQYGHPACNVDLGVCPHPLSPDETPPAIGTPSALGGNQVRLVFSKPLALGIEKITTNEMTGAITGYELVDPTIIGFYDAKGREMAAVKYWDPSGSPMVTSNLFSSPLGPALVIKPRVAMLPLTSYSIRIKPAELKDLDGQVAKTDGNGDAVATEYAWKTEGLVATGGAIVDLKGAIDVMDALVIRTNTRFDPSTLKVTVLKGGAPVETVAAPEYGLDPKKCGSAAESPTLINVFRIQGVDRADWEEGTGYTVAVEAVATDNRAATMSASPFGGVPYADHFEVKRGADKYKQYLALDRLLPWECAASSPADMAVMPDLAARPPDLAPPPDLAAPLDMAAPAYDMSVPPVDAGAGN